MTWLLQILQSSIPVGFAVLTATLLVRGFLKSSEERYAVLMSGMLLIPAMSLLLASSSNAAPLESFGLDQSWLLKCWCAGVAVASVRMLCGLFSVRQMLSHSLPNSIEWVDASVKALSSKLALKRVPAVRISTSLISPCVVGLLKPVVLLPASLLARLSPCQIEALLAHELAHVKRFDYWANLLQMVVETVLFFHPAVWLLSHLTRLEREACCDDIGVKVCGSRAEYATALASAAAYRTSLAAPAFTTGALTVRVARIAGVRRSPGLHVPRLVLSAAVGLVLLTFGTVGAAKPGLRRVLSLPEGGGPIFIKLDGDRKPTRLILQERKGAEAPSVIKGWIYFLKRPIVRQPL